MFRTLWLATEWRAEAAHADTLSSPRWRFLGSRPGRRNPRGTVTNLPPKAPNTHTPTRGETPRGPVRRSPDRLPSEGTDKRPQKSAPLSLSYHGIIRPSAAMRRPAPTRTNRLTSHYPPTTKTHNLDPILGPPPNSETGVTVHGRGPPDRDSLTVEFCLSSMFIRTPYTKRTKVPGTLNWIWNNGLRRLHP